MSEKYQIDGPGGEVLGLHFQTITQDVLMIGSKLKYLPFLNHVVFNTMKFLKKDVIKKGVRQKHKYRYYFSIEEPKLKAKMYVLREKYKVTEIDSIIKIT